MIKNDILLEMKGITKSYFGNTVLKDIDLTLHKGEIHSLVGENGAGKSTLMNILFGMDVIHKTGGFEGEVLLEGEPLNVRTPKEAMEYGIGMVHQEFMLIPGFTVSENIKLNREITKSTLASKLFGQRLENINLEEMNKDARNALDRLNIDLSELSKVKGLPVGYMQFIEIAREIDKKNLKLLVFDEPTAVLTEAEADHLLSACKKLTDQGIAILFISHRLDEVLELSDNITVLRDGELITCKKAEDSSIEELAELMVGRKVNIQQKEKAADQDDKVILKLKDFHVHMPGEEVKGINLDVKEGEILGIGGLAGQGKIGIANGIMGLYKSEGTFILDGEVVDDFDPKAILNKGLAFVSEDRKGVGLILDESIELNIATPAMSVQGKFLKKFGSFRFLDSKQVRSHAKELIDQLDIRCTGPKQYVGNLSGGNQQKVCIARALTMDPNILLVSEPTRGIDIGAKKLVLDLLLKLNKEFGMTIIMTSSELAELRSISDRIAIVSEGDIAGILPPDASDQEFGLLMSGRIHEKEGVVV